MKKCSGFSLFLSIAVCGAVLIMSPRPAESQEVTKVESTVEKAPAPVAPGAMKQIFETMMGALESGDYQAFVSGGNDHFKKELTPKLFMSVVTGLGPKLEEGHEFLYFGELKKGGAMVYVWRVRLKTTPDDIMAEMTITDEKVNGFWLR